MPRPRPLPRLRPRPKPLPLGARAMEAFEDWIYCGREKRWEDRDTAPFFKKDSCQETFSPSVSGGNSGINFLDCRFAVWQQPFQRLEADFIGADWAYRDLMRLVFNPGCALVRQFRIVCYPREQNMRIE